MQEILISLQIKILLNYLSKFKRIRVDDYERLFMRLTWPDKN
jgi:hypothetical protein